MKAKKQARKGKKNEPAREERISQEIVVDAYGAQEQAMGWYCYLEGSLEFPFGATCVKRRAISPLKLKERVEVVGMAPDDECEHEMFVAVLWSGRRFSVPLEQLACECRGRSAGQAVEDWQYWVRQGYQFG
ncbi:MAG: calcium-binding protein [Nitrospirota bacterium]